MTGGELVFGSFCLSLARRELLKDGIPVPLGSRAFDLLTALVQRQGSVVGKDELLAEVWPDTVVEENNLQVQISALRKALGEGPKGSRHLLTVPGRGYRFVGAVGRAARPASSSPLPEPSPPRRSTPAAREAFDHGVAVRQHER